jgi:peroxiredoxin
LASYARTGERFERAGLQRVAIVVDSIEQNAAMNDKLLLDFPILSDPQSRVIKQWDVYNEREDVAVPSIFLVEPDGAIRYSYRGFDYSDRPTDDELFAAVAEMSADGAR